MIDDSAKTAAYHVFRRWPSTQWGLTALQGITRMGAARTPRDLPVTRVQIPRRSGAGTIPALVIRPKQADGPLPIMLHLHGGGYVIGMPAQDYERFQRFLVHRPCVIVAPAYRLALSDPFPAGLDDCHEAALWAVANADTLGGDPAQLMVMGESAGGGLAAALALRARERGDLAIAAQLPFYAMLDDRPENWTALPDRQLVWNRAKNRLGWARYLAGVDPVPDQGAPARARDLSGLPPAYGVVGDQDLFADENTAYFNRLAAAGVRTRFSVLPGCYHGAEVLAPGSDTARASWRLMLDAFDHATQTCHAPQPAP